MICYLLSFDTFTGYLGLSEFDLGPIPTQQLNNSHFEALTPKQLQVVLITLIDRAAKGREEVVNAPGPGSETDALLTPIWQKPKVGTFDKAYQ